MYAIVEIAGQQFKVEKDQKYFVHQLEGKPGSKVTFENVLLLDDNGKVSVGAPAVNGVQVTAKIEQHLLGDKIIIFKKKRRKGYKVKNGHRQRLTEITVQEIGKKAAPKKADLKSEAKVETKKVAPKKTAVKSEAKAETKKVAPKKAASKKAPANSKPAVASKTKKES
jgi:large subunit ribosomal protein L21